MVTYLLSKQHTNSLDGVHLFKFSKVCCNSEKSLSTEVRFYFPTKVENGSVDLLDKKKMQKIENYLSK